MTAMQTDYRNNIVSSDATAAAAMLAAQQAATAASSAGTVASGANTAASTAKAAADKAAADAASAAATAAAAKAAALQSGVAWIADVVITYSSVIALNLAPRTKAFTSTDSAEIAKAKVDDRVYVHRHGKPTLGGANLAAGVVIEGTGFVPSDGSVEVYHVIPAVGVGQTLNIPLRLVGYRAVAAS